MRNYILLACLLLPLIGYSQCKALRKKKEKSTGKFTITTDPREPVSMSKVIQEGATTYYIRLLAPASATGDKKGVFVNVADKTLLKWPDEAVSVTAERQRAWRNNPLTASSTLSLTADQLHTFATNRISDYELIEFEWTLKGDSGELFRKQVECLVNTMPRQKKRRD